MSRRTRRELTYIAALVATAYGPLLATLFLTQLKLIPARTDFFLLLGIGPTVIIYAVSLTLIRAHRERLRARGYDWLGTMQVGRLFVALGSRIRQIPPRDQLATLPGYKEGDIESIIDLMERTAPRR